MLWQTGPTDTEGLDIDPVVHLTSDELLRAMEEADVVIAHAGIGSALMAMRAGKCPVLMPRQRAHREHVDDHQKEIATILGDLGLALDAGAEVLDYALLALASERRVVCNDGAPPFVLRAK
ncbi:MAG: glycosyltransferase [Acidimicrobiales bacterium]